MSNSKLRSFAIAGVSAAALSAAAGLAHAQDGTAIEEVVVTATKREVSVQDVPTAVSVLSGDAIEKFQLSTFTDLSRLDPALQFSSNGIGDSRIIVRGIQSGGAATVALYLDESVITGQTFESSTGGAQPDIGLHDIERVEVLKGPQGTLFGASSMSGAVRIITKKPELTSYSGSIGGTASWGSGTSGLYETDGVVNIPVVKDQLGVRLVGWYSSGGGYIDSVSSGEKNINDYTIGGLRGTALWTPNDKFKLTLTGIYQDIEVDGSQRYEAALGPYDNRSPTLEPYEENLKLFSAVAEYDLGFGTVTAASSYFDRQTDAFVDSTPTATGFGLPGAYAVLNSAGRAIWSSELRFASDFEGPLQLVGGASYQDDDNEYENVVSQTGANTVPDCNRYASCVAQGLATKIVSARHVNSPLKSTALFGEANYKVTDQLTFTAGIRRFNSTQHNTELTLQSLRFPSSNPASVQAAPTVALDAKVKQHKTSFNFAVSYEPSSALTFYARAASGFRQGGINNAAFAANFGTTIPQGFNPDQVWNYEAGVKGVAFDNMLSFEAAAFHIDWSDQQVPAVSSNGAFTFTTNAGKSVVNGVEVQGALRPVTGLRVTVGGAYTDSHLTQDQPPTSGDENAPGRKGDRLPYVSKWSMAAQASYEWPAFGDWKGYVQGNANYRSKAHTFFNTDNPYYQEVADYVLADLGGGVKNDRYDLGVFIHNVGDKAAAISVDTGPDGFRISTVRPRTFGVSLRASF